MSVYYVLFGVISSIALAVNVLLLVALLSLLQATLTLPGIAAIALTLGMAIDANVLINERIREELRGGATPQAAIHAGYERAWATILDSNVTTFIVGISLLMVPGAVRGFAVVHCLGILTSMFSAVVGVARHRQPGVRPPAARRAALHRRHRVEMSAGIGMEFFKIRRTIPFMRYALVFNIISLVTFLAAVGFLAFRGLNFSIEFTGGTLIEVGYKQAADVDAIRRTLEGAGYKAEVQNFGSSRDVLIRMHLEKNQSSADLSQKVVEILKDEDQTAELRRVEFVGPQIGSELVEYGALALLVTAVGIVLYLWMRFEWRFGLSGIIANLHDVVIILGFFAFFQWEFSLPVLAAVLAVLGYSVNESVVVFDRVRENFRKMRKATTAEVIDAPSPA